MTEQESFQEMFKSKLDQLKEKTLLNLITKDPSYLEISTELDEAENQYHKLDISKSQREVIDNYLSTTESCNMEYATLSYLAGLIDGQKIGHLLPLTQDALKENPDIIRQFYYETIQPCAEPCETPKTLDYWKEIGKEESKLAASFSPEQEAIFDQISTKRLQACSNSMGDSFVFGFRFGVKLLLGVLG